MPRGANAEREREYEKLVRKFEESGRYGGRKEEVAARIVNKQRAEYGETKKAKKQERQGKSPDRDLPIDGYRHLTVAEIKPKLGELSKKELEALRRYERAHKDRRTLLEAIDKAA